MALRGVSASGSGEAVELPAGQVCDHDQLERRLIEECAAARRRGSQFALARIQVRPGGTAAEVDRMVLEVLGPGDVLAVYGPDEYEALLLDDGPDVPGTLGEGLATGLRRRGVAARCGLSLYPRDGTSPQALLTRACERVRRALGESPDDRASRVVVVAPAVSELHELARRAAARRSNVLVVGEMGVGKEILAHSIHRLSPRAERPFVAINCAAHGESVADLLHAAAGGTLFLDGIDQMPMPVQVNLVRSLKALGPGALRRTLDVRFVAATSVDLEEEAMQGRFRHDLLAPLAGVTLEIPPLRERTDEIELLARFFLQRAAHETGHLWSSVSPEALDRLRRYAWPGNIRELRNIMERAAVLCGGDTVTPEHLPIERMARAPWPPPHPIARETLVAALERCGGDHSRAAELVGTPRPVFRAWLAGQGIPGRSA
jgi:DNA-binding NtrC family response regulator